MSLSFVASAVLTTTADGGFEETKIESKQNDAINQRNASKPLFEQLRQNQEEAEAKQEEAKLEMMRGAGALDDEDVAHLDALQKQRQERERDIQQRMQDELLQFRAARAERLEGGLEQEEEEEEESSGISPSSGGAGVASAVPRQSVEPAIQQQHVVPRIVVKKRKLRMDSSGKDTSTTEKTSVKKQKEESKDDQQKSVEGRPGTQKQTPPAAGLGGLLSGYGSSDDDSDQ